MRHAGWGLLLLGCTALPTLLTCGGRQEDSDGTQNIDGQDSTARLVSLIVTPDNAIIQADLNTEATKQFSIRASFADGSSADYSRKVKLTVDNTGIGKFVGPMFHSSTLTANKVDFARVTAKVPGDTGNITGVANLTVVWLRTSGNSQDFFFELPYMQDPQTKPLTFSTQVQSLDVFFNEDTTGSMGGEINALVRSLGTTIIPGVKAAAAKDAWFGVGSLDDFPAEGHGSPGCNGLHDQPFILLQPMTDDVMKAQSAVQQLLNGFGGPAGCGGDLPEGQLEALYQIATGEGNTMGGVVNIPPHTTGIGGVEFRDGALPVVVTITDAVFHTTGEPNSGTCFGSPNEYGGQVGMAAHSRQKVTDALNKICAKSVGISALRTGVDADCLATTDLTYFANATGAIVPPEAWDIPMRPANCPAGQCCTGLSGAGEPPDMNGLCPLTFKIPMDGTAVGDQVANGIAQLAQFASFDVVTDVQGQTMGEKGEVLPPGKTTADFIKSIVPLDALPPPPPPIIKTPIRTDTGFQDVVPGSFVRFNVQAVNSLVKETSQPQVFHATIRVRAGGCANLDSRDVIILIPPVAPTPG